MKEKTQQLAKAKIKKVVWYKMLDVNSINIDYKYIYISLSFGIWLDVV